MLILVGILFGGIFSYQIFKAHMIKKYMSQNSAPAVTVSTTKAVFEEWQPKIQASGSLRAVRGVDVTSEIAGLVRNIYFKSGMKVQQGDKLLQLNDDAEAAQLNSLKATAQLNKSTLDRDKAQYAIKAISKAVLEVDQANLQSIQAQVNQQMATIAKKNIQAPFAGRLGITTVNPGQYINPGDKIVTLQTLDPIYVDFYIPQQFFKNVAKGQTIEIHSDTQPNTILKGIISTIDPKVDPATRNIHVEGKISNVKENLLPGMFVTVKILSGKKKQFLTLPQSAIAYNPYGEMSFIVTKNEKNEDIATQVPVKVGDTRGDQVAVLKGIKNDDIVITGGQLKLKNGMKVIINNTIEPNNNPAPKPNDE